METTGTEQQGGPAWEEAFGELRYLHRETKRIEQTIEEEFEAIDEEEWRYVGRLISSFG